MSDPIAKLIAFLPEPLVVNRNKEVREKNPKIQTLCFRNVIAKQT